MFVCHCLGRKYQVSIWEAKYLAQELSYRQSENVEL